MPEVPDTEQLLVRAGQGDASARGELLQRHRGRLRRMARHGLMDHRTDVYSLGATLYELLTLRPAVDGHDKHELLKKIAFEEPVTPRKVDRAIPPELETITLKALVKNPTERYATAAELADDLRRWLEQKTIRARRPSLRQRLDKWVRRHSGAVAAALVALMLGTAVSTWQALRATSAAAAEWQAKETAQQRLSQVEKANDILESVFHDLDPKAEEKEGKPLRALLGERLDRASQELVGESVGDPLAVAKLQMTLGSSQSGLGYFERAIALFARARATYTAKLGPEHPDTLTSMRKLAASYHYAGKRDQALPLAEETFKLANAILGPEHPDTLSCMNMVAVVYWSAAKLDQALPLMEEVLRLTKASLGPEHRETLTRMGNLAVIAREAGKLDLALPLYEEVLTLCKAMHGPKHPNTLRAMNGLAMMYWTAGKLDLALPLWEEAFKLQIVRLGPEHPDTLQSMANLAFAQSAAGKPDLALPLYEESFQLTKAKLGAEHPETLRTMRNFAEAYAKARKYDEAIRLCQELLAIHRSKLPPDDLGLATALYAMGQTLLEARQPAEAESFLRECLAIREKADLDAWKTFNTKSLLGGALLAQKKYPEAEPILLQGYVGMKQRESRIYPVWKYLLAEAAERIVALYEATGRPEVAKVWREKLPSKTP